MWELVRNCLKMFFFFFFFPSLFLSFFLSFFLPSSLPPSSHHPFPPSSLPLQVGRDNLSYIISAIHNLPEAEEKETKCGLPRQPFLLFPPTPVSRVEDHNWPILTGFYLFIYFFFLFFFFLLLLLLLLSFCTF